MWKDYSIGFLRKYRAASLSVLAAAFISALFLSLLCSLSYNLWKYEVESVTLEEGSWQGRISGVFDESIVSAIQNFANVKTVQINTELSDEEHLVIDICFQNIRTIYQDLPLIAEHFDVGDNSVSFIDGFLSGGTADCISVFNSDHSQLFCSIHESPYTSAWHPFQHRSHTRADPCLFIAGSRRSLYPAYIIGNRCRDRIKFWNYPAYQCSGKGNFRQARSSFCLSSDTICDHHIVSYFNSLCFCMAACKKTK